MMAENDMKGDAANGAPGDANGGAANGSSGNVKGGNAVVKKTVASMIMAFLTCAFGSLVVAFALNQVLKPAGFSPGGVTGLSVLVNKISSNLIPVGVAQIVMNIPLFILGYRTLGREFIFRSIMGTLMTSIFVDALSFTANYWVLETEPILSAIWGGVLLGIGYGIIFRTGATTGGTDIAARILQKKMGYLTLGQLLLFFNIMFLVVVGLVNWSVSAALYTGITVFISSKVVDQVEGGVNYAKEVLLVSDKAQEIGSDVISELGRGATILHGKGAFTGKEHPVLWVVVYNRQLPKLREIAARHDPGVFIAIKDVREAKGLMKTGRF